MMPANLLGLHHYQKVLYNPTEWVQANITGLATRDGDGPTVGRTNLSVSTYVKNAVITHVNTVNGGKYAYRMTVPGTYVFDNVSIENIDHVDGYGAAIAATDDSVDSVCYVVDSYLDPNFPAFVSYATTNSDGMDVDHSGSTSASGLYMWNTEIRRGSDGLIDNKMWNVQIVGSILLAGGNFGIRLWRPGITYIVDTTINMSDTSRGGQGKLFWVDANAGGQRIRYFNCTFIRRDQSSSDTLLASDIAGAVPAERTKLTTDPRTTGEMHPMFQI